MSKAEANNEFFADFLDDYFAESDEHLTVVRRNLLALDMNVNQPRPDQSLLDQLLRSFHSIKGLSGMVGVREAEQIAHEMESYLRALRSEQVSLTGEGLDALIGGTKMLEQVIEARRASNPAPDIANIIKQINAVLPKEPTASSPEEEEAVKEQPEEDISPELLAPPPETRISEVQLNPSAEEKQRLGAAVRDGARAWHFEFAPMPELAARGVNVNYIRDRLQGAGQLIHAAPRVQNSGGIVFDFLVASNVPETTFADWGNDGLTWRQYSNFELPLPETEPPGATESPPAEEVGESQSGRGAKSFSPVQEQENGRARERESETKEQLPPIAPSSPPPFTPSVALPHKGADLSALSENTGALPLSGSLREGETNKSAVPIPAPSNVVRVDLAKLDELMRMVGELVTSRARLEDRLNLLEQEVSAAAVRPLREVNQTMERQLRDLRESVTRARLVPIGEIFARMQFAVRDLARESQKKVSLTLSGQQTEIDKFVVERMMDPLLHLVRNAVSHGLETEEERTQLGKPPEGNLALRAGTVGEMVAIEIEDDGRGVDVEKVAARARELGLLPLAIALPEEAVEGKLGERESARKEQFPPIAPLPPLFSDSELLDILCAPGFSVREEADLTSGRGVGMTIVKNTVQELGGTLTMQTRAGAGTRFAIQLPLTLAIADALIVVACGQTYAVPQSSIEGTVEVRLDESTLLENNQVIFYRGGVLPLWSLKRLFNLSDSNSSSGAAGFEVETKKHVYAFVVGQGKNAIGIVVDRLIGLREIVVRPLKDPLVQVPGISGATDLGDGRVILILDAVALSKKTQIAPAGNRARARHSP